MSKLTGQSFEAACTRFVGWLDSQVTAAGRGHREERLDVNPADRFWLGLLDSRSSVEEAQRRLGDRGERLSPCALGIRIRPRRPNGPWQFTATFTCRAWIKDNLDLERPWRRSPLVRVRTQIIYDGRGEEAFGRVEAASAFAAAGVEGLSAEITVARELWRGSPELMVQVVNTSPAKVGPLQDGSTVSQFLYEVELAVEGLDTMPYLLESLPDSFRYDRRVAAYGHNCGVSYSEGIYRSTDTIVINRGRPGYDAAGTMPVDLNFKALAADPLPLLRRLSAGFKMWVDETWSDEALLNTSQVNGWDARMLEEARTEATKARDEAERISAGLDLLETDPLLCRAFQLMNESIAISAMRHDGTSKYSGWRPFQIAFLLATLSAVRRESSSADIVDTVWFATGGGKTETYLGLLVTTALYERLNGRVCGVTAWSRFPLRMLSLQQTQRFANALAGAELVRRKAGIPGEPISLGYFVGERGGTPNRIPKEIVRDSDPDVEDPRMPSSYQVLLQCPFCKFESIEMGFDRVLWKLEHRCRRRGSGCPWPERALPFYVVDDELFRFLPTVVLGTLDKAALMGSQASIIGFFAPPGGYCSQFGHGHTYATRSKKPNGCLVPDCRGTAERLPQATRWYGLTMRLQDELHLLRDSLGAVDAHYESLIDHVQQVRGGSRCKVIASSATLSGHDRQVEILFERSGRVFPQQGVVSGSSFWSREANPEDELLRRFVAVAPRGATHEFVSDRTVETLQRALLRLHQDPAGVCREANVSQDHAERLLSYYGVNVVYGNTVRDVEAIRRSLEGQVQVDMMLNAVTLTGNSSFEDVRKALSRLEEPEEAYEDRIHAVAASSMLSHGVDVERLNIMVVHGLPLTTAEFIQTTARVGRRFPGLVYVLHRMSRERDAASFRQFEPFVRQGDRFVEPVPVTRRSRRVLDLTLPGIMEARRLLVFEPGSRARLTTVSAYLSYLTDRGVTSRSELENLLRLLGYQDDEDHVLSDHIKNWLELWEYGLRHPAPTARFPSEALPGGIGPMKSLRDVESSAPIYTQ